MDNKVFIWDLDGTLLDSYAVIVNSLMEAYADKGISLKRAEVDSYVIEYSVSDFVKMMEQKTGLDYTEMRSRYSVIADRDKADIVLAKNAREVLDALAAKGARNMVFTHRGHTTEFVLKNLGIFDCFDDIIASTSGFARKPAPDALNYLIRKHNLSREKVFYVGDRTIDMDCAKGAGVRGILYIPKGSFCKPNGSESYTVSDLIEIEKYADR